jgi:hypothetical protein
VSIEGERRGREWRLAETEASLIFRSEMTCDQIAARIQSAGYDPDALDLDALNAVSVIAGLVKAGSDVLLLVVPVRDCDADEFDRILCAAGVKRFLRPALPGDPGAPAPDLPPPDKFLVEEVAPGVRTRRPARPRGERPSS